MTIELDKLNTYCTICKQIYTFKVIGNFKCECQKCGRIADTRKIGKLSEVIEQTRKLFR